MARIRVAMFRRAHPEIDICGNERDGWYAVIPVCNGYKQYVYRESLDMLLNRVEALTGPDHVNHPLT